MPKRIKKKPKAARREEKSRFLYLHPEANRGKILELDGLQDEYTKYLRICVDLLLSKHVFNLDKEDKREFFPQCLALGSQIVKNVQDHAIGMVNGWAAVKYSQKLRSYIGLQVKDKAITECQAKSLYTVGKHLIGQPWKFVAQADLDLYWLWLLNPEISGLPPRVSNACGMRMSEMTCVLAVSEDELRRKPRPSKTFHGFKVKPRIRTGIKYESTGRTVLTQWWLSFTGLKEEPKPGKSKAQPRRTWLPLKANPYIKRVEDAGKGVHARKLKTGAWRFEVLDVKDWLIPEAQLGKKVSFDVGLNCIAVDSNGRTYGRGFKAQFDPLWYKIKALRANRKQQGLTLDSPRVERLESKLSGMIATCVGEISNDIVRSYPGYLLVLEALDLQGCSGQKRFAYLGLHNSLGHKACCSYVNPAYTSQECPNCHYVSRSNRSGVKFKCRSCGKICHADWVGSHNIPGRSDTKSIMIDDDPIRVKAVLDARHAAWRKRQAALSVQGRLRKKDELNRSAGELTVKGSSVEDIRIASNSGVS